MHKIKLVIFTGADQVFLSAAVPHRHVQRQPGGRFDDMALGIADVGGRELQRNRQPARIEGPQQPAPLRLRAKRAGQGGYAKPRFTIRKQAESEEEVNTCTPGPTRSNSACFSSRCGRVLRA